MEQETLYNILSGAYGEVLETHAMWECIASLGIKPYKDGNQWCYLYGDNIQDGVVGFGETIFKAAWNFYSQIKTEEIAKCEHRGSSKTPKDLEEAAKEYCNNNDPTYQCCCDCIMEVFKAGAKWQREKDNKELSEKIAAAYQLGLADKEKKMLKEAVEVVVWDAGVDFAPHPVISVEDFNVKDGDKVRIIIVKED